MKLVTLLAIEIYKDEIIQILKKAGVLSFSYTNIIGYQNNKTDDLNSNWFGTEIHQSESVIFIAFIHESLLNKLFEHTNSFNETLSSTSRIHISTLSVERSNLL